jgi:hypothetical protein
MRDPTPRESGHLWGSTGGQTLVFSGNRGSIIVKTFGLESFTKPLVWELRAFQLDKKSVSVSTPPLLFKALFTVSNKVFRRQEWSDLTRDHGWRLSLTPTLLSVFTWFSHGLLTSTWWKTRQLEDEACWTSSLTGEAACPSETVCCSTGNWTVLRWIKRPRSRG